MNDHDRKVQATNTDATMSKLSCVKAGYLEDEFVHLFATCSYPILRRNPIINLGHYIRSMTMRRVIDTFLSTWGETETQIVSIGAGYDTNGFRALKNFAHVKIFEIDFFDVILHKLKVLRQKWDKNFRFIAKTDFPDYTLGLDGEVVWNTSVLSLISTDLRASTDVLEQKLNACNFDPTKPTLIMSECCLVYLDEIWSTHLLTFLSSLSKNVCMALYEQVNSEDAFGRMMVENLKLRGCPLLSILPSVKAVEDRFLGCGFLSCEIELMSHFTPLIKTMRPEIIDEMEEFNLFQGHYFLGLASNQYSLGFMRNVFTQNDNSAT